MSREPREQEIVLHEGLGYITVAAHGSPPAIFEAHKLTRAIDYAGNLQDHFGWPISFTGSSQ